VIDDVYFLTGGALQSNLAGCLDVDLGFTPATNLIVMRRLTIRGCSP
jgi:hypothetical protein